MSDIADEFRREAALWRQTSAANRREADRCAHRLGLLEEELEAARRRIAALLVGNSDLYSDLTNIITTAEATGASPEIARRARRARDRLPQEGL